MIMDLDQIATGLAFLALGTTAVKLFWNLIDRERGINTDDSAGRERERCDGDSRRGRDRPGLD